MMAMGVPVIRFVRYIERSNRWRCHGEYERDENDNWVLMSTPCTGAKRMSTIDIFERHVKRCHFKVEKELGNDRFGLIDWARGKLHSISSFHRRDSAESETCPFIPDFPISLSTLVRQLRFVL
jgi:hypothetical protein